MAQQKDFELIGCPDCGLASKLVPAARPYQDVDVVLASFLTPFGQSATQLDRAAWCRCERCGNYIRQRQGRVAGFFSRLFFGSRARPGTVIRPPGGAGVGRG